MSEAQQAETRGQGAATVGGSHSGGMKAPGPLASALRRLLLLGARHGRQRQQEQERQEKQQKQERGSARRATRKFWTAVLCGCGAPSTRSFAVRVAPPAAAAALRAAQPQPCGEVEARVPSGLSAGLGSADTFSAFAELHLRAARRRATTSDTSEPADGTEEEAGSSAAGAGSPPGRRLTDTQRAVLADEQEADRAWRDSHEFRLRWLAIATHHELSWSEHEMCDHERELLKRLREPSACLSVASVTSEGPPQVPAAADRNLKVGVSRDWDMFMEPLDMVGGAGLSGLQRRPALAAGCAA